MREIKEVFIHCSATMPNMDIGVEEIRRWHKARGWLDVGYHWVIRRDGTVEQGRSEWEVGAHARLHNLHSIGICLVGGLDEDMKPTSRYSSLQWKALEKLVREIVDRHDLSNPVNVSMPYHLSKIIRGHNEVSTKSCPCFDVKQWVLDTFHEDEPELCPHCGQEM